MPMRDAHDATRRPSAGRHGSADKVQLVLLAALGMLTD
jgi:hypothetical protein